MFRATLVAQQDSFPFWVSRFPYKVANPNKGKNNNANNNNQHHHTYTALVGKDLLYFLEGVSSSK